MYVKKSVLLALCFAMISLITGIGMVAYHWGYMQCDIDNLVTGTSAPASVTMIVGIPFIIITLILILFAIILAKRK